MLQLSPIPRSSILLAAVAGLSVASTSVALADSQLHGRIAHHAQMHGVPVSLAKAVIRIESNFRPRAANAGNFGLMQVRLNTARSMGYRGGAAGLLDAETNLTYGMRYLAMAHRLAGGDACGTIARYNGGLRATRLTAGGRAYCVKARAYMANLSQ